MAKPIARLADLLRRRAAEQPAAPALDEANTSVSYGQLLERSERITKQLLAKGVVAGDRVMIVAENGIAQIAAFFAASLLDAWPVLINARMTAHEVDTILEHCDPRIVLFAGTQSSDAAAHAERHDATLANGDALRWGAVRTAAIPEIGTKAQPVAALIYTSGTTGAPKGVMVTHRGLLHFAARSAVVRGQTADDVVFGALPMAHIFGLATILLTTIWAGGRLFLMPRFDPRLACQAIRDRGITILHGVPSLYSRLLGWIAETGQSVDWQRLRYVYVGGGALDIALKRRIERALGRPAHHGYGMTEYAGSMFVTHVDHPRDDALPGEINPDCEVRFVDTGEQDVPSGQSGEIWIRGPGTMAGYFRAPQLTAEAMSHDGWLRTGDIGCLHADGALSIVGRLRDVIKSAGFLVYPAEVEAELARIPGLRLAAVIGLPNRDGDEDVIAVIELEPAGEFDADAVGAQLRARLAGYKLPRRFEIVDALPLTLNGKVRKAELRQRFVST